MMVMVLGRASLHDGTNNTTLHYTTTRWGDQIQPKDHDLVLTQPLFTPLALQEATYVWARGVGASACVMIDD
jgi:hypothetical protein